MALGYSEDWHWYHCPSSIRPVRVLSKMYPQLWRSADLGRGLWHGVAHAADEESFHSSLYVDAELRPDMSSILASPNPRNESRANTNISNAFIYHFFPPQLFTKTSKHLTSLQPPAVLSRRALVRLIRRIFPIFQFVLPKIGRQKWAFQKDEEVRIGGSNLPGTVDQRIRRQLSRPRTCLIIISSIYPHHFSSAIILRQESWEKSQKSNHG